MDDYDRRVSELEVELDAAERRIIELKAELARYQVSLNQGVYMVCEADYQKFMAQAERIRVLEQERP